MDAHAGGYASPDVDGRAPLLLPASGPRDRALLLGVRPADLRRLRDVRACRHPLPGSRGSRAARPGDADPAAARAPRAGHRARHGNAPITKALIAINVAIYLITASQGGGPQRPRREPLPSSSDPLRALVVAHGGWYRLVTAMFLHASIVHIGFNMFALWVIGTPVEQYLGTARYIGLYFVSGLAGSAGALLSAPHTPSLGASGAVFGVLGAMMILEWQITGRLAGNAMTWIVINLVISFAVPGISWGGHIGGLIGGILITLALRALACGRAQYGQLGIRRASSGCSSSPRRASRSRTSASAATPSVRRGPP